MIVTILSLMGTLALSLFGLKLLSQVLFRWFEPKLRKWLLTDSPHLLKGMGRAMLACLLSLAPLSNQYFVTSLADLNVIPVSKVLPYYLGIQLGTVLIAWLFAMIFYSPGLSLVAMILLMLGLPFFQSFHVVRKSRGDLLMGLGLLVLGLELLKSGFSELQRDENFFILIRHLSSSLPSLWLFVAGGLSLGLIYRSNLSVIVLAMVLGPWLSFLGGLLMILGSYLGTMINPLLIFFHFKVPGRQASLIWLELQLSLSLLGLSLIPFFQFLEESLFPLSTVSGTNMYPLKMVLFLTVLHFMSTPLLLALSRLLLKLSQRINLEKLNPQNLSSVSISLESHLLSCRNQASKLIEVTYDTLLSLMDLTQSLTLRKVSHSRFSNVLSSFHDNLEHFQTDLALAILHQTSHQEAVELQFLQTLSIYLERTETLIQRIYKIVQKSLKQNNIYFQRVSNRVFRLISYILDIMRYNQDQLLGKAWTTEVSVIHQLEQAIHRLRRKIKDTTHKLIKKKKTANVRYLSAQLEALELLHQIAHLQQTIGNQIASIKQKGPEV